VIRQPNDPSAGQNGQAPEKTGQLARKQGQWQDIGADGVVADFGKGLAGGQSCHRGADGLPVFGMAQQKMATRDLVSLAPTSWLNNMLLHHEPRFASG